METGIGRVSVERIGASPPGRGVRPRPRVTVNADYVRRLLEERRLTERDELLLKYLDEVGVLTSRQIKLLLWSEASWAGMHRRLRKLYDYYLLDRARMLNKKEGITYVLGKAGRIWLHGSARGGDAPRVNARMLAHELGVSETLVQVRQEFEDIDYQGEWGFRLGWRNRQNARMVKGERMVLEPDAFFYYYSTQGKRKIRGGYFLEMDMGTMRGGAFAEKAKRYRRWVRAETWEAYQQGSGVKLEEAGVMVLTTTQRRAQNLAKQVAREWGGTEEALMWWFNTLGSVAKKGIFGRKDWIVVTREGKYYEEVELEYPTADAGEMYRQGVSWEKRGDTEMALMYYGKSLEIEGENAEVYFRIGNIFFHRQRWEEAIEKYGRALEIAPGRASVYGNRGLAQERAGNEQAALADFRAMLALGVKGEVRERTAKRIRVLESELRKKKGE